MFCGRICPLGRGYLAVGNHGLFAGFPAVEGIAAERTGRLVSDVAPVLFFVLISFIRISSDNGLPGYAGLILFMALVLQAAAAAVLVRISRVKQGGRNGMR